MVEEDELKREDEDEIMIVEEDEIKREDEDEIKMVEEDKIKREDKDEIKIVTEDEDEIKREDKDEIKKEDEDEIKREDEDEIKREDEDEIKMVEEMKKGRCVEDESERGSKDVMKEDEGLTNEELGQLPTVSPWLVDLFVQFSSCSHISSSLPPTYQQSIVTYYNQCCSKIFCS